MRWSLLTLYEDRFPLFYTPHSQTTQRNATPKKDSWSSSLITARIITCDRARRGTQGKQWWQIGGIINPPQDLFSLALVFILLAWTNFLRNEKQFYGRQKEAHSGTRNIVVPLPLCKFNKEFSPSSLHISVTLRPLFSNFQKETGWRTENDGYTGHVFRSRFHCATFIYEI